jgi:hypothetical protein
MRLRHKDGRIRLWRKQATEKEFSIADASTWLSTGFGFWIEEKYK